MALHSPRFATNTRLQNAALNRPVMNWGEVGEAVRLVQQGLIDLGFPMPICTRVGSPDGIFGDETKAMVRAFQARHGLASDGIAGANTLARLDSLLPRAGAPLPRLPENSWITHRFKVVFRSIAMVAVIPEMADTRTVFGLYGFRVDEGAGRQLALSPDEELTLNVMSGSCSPDHESDEQRLLFSLGGGRAGVGATDIMVYYVFRIRSFGVSLVGCAAHKPGAPAVIVAENAPKYAMAHEVGHVLLGSRFTPVHHPSSTNLMVLDVFTADPPGLTETQVRAMRASTSCTRL